MSAKNQSKNKVRRTRTTSREPGFDEENPEWTEQDFARAKPPHKVLSPQALSAFKRTRGAQKVPTKVPVSIRLSAEVVEHFRATGPGWQGRIDASLKKAIARKR